MERIPFRDDENRLWKAGLAGMLGPMLAMAGAKWLPVWVAWFFAMFAVTFAFRWTPPRLPEETFARALLVSATAGCVSGSIAFLAHHVFGAWS